MMKQSHMNMVMQFSPMKDCGLLKIALVSKKLYARAWRTCFQPSIVKPFKKIPKRANGYWRKILTGVRTSGGRTMLLFGI